MEKRLTVKNEGFSLVELIIVIAIMGILVGVVGTQVVPYMEKAREAKDRQILSSVATAFTASVAMAVSGESRGFQIFNCPIDKLKNANGQSLEFQKKVSDQVIELLLPEGEEKKGRSLQQYLGSKFTSKKAKDKPTIFISYYSQIGKLYVFLSDTEAGDGLTMTTDGIMYISVSDELIISDKVFMYVESD